MSGHLYILTDGINTKIGITISLDKRLSSYTTHNPNFYTYKVYNCPIEEAKKIENTVKHHFKDKLSGASKEWFSVHPEEINKIVSSILDKPIEENITPAMHGVKLSSEARSLKDKTLSALAKHKGYNTPESHEQKQKLAELFASSFNLGTPEHRLPQNIVMKDSLNVDLLHCDKSSSLVCKAIQGNHIKLPYDDHLYSFYHLIKLATGSYIAICTSRVSMPYLDRIEGKNAEILDAASQLGLYAFNYHDWSWHYPEKSGLILYMQKTPVPERLRLWNNSLRKWVIERSKLLEQEKFGNAEEQETLEKTIYDTCNDETFPLEAQTVEEFYDNYMKPFWGYAWNDEDPHFMMGAYKFLFEKWKSK